MCADDVSFFCERLKCQKIDDGWRNHEQNLEFPCATTIPFPPFLRFLENLSSSRNIFFLTFLVENKKSDSLLPFLARKFKLHYVKLGQFFALPNFWCKISSLASKEIRKPKRTFFYDPKVSFKECLY